MAGTAGKSGRRPKPTARKILAGNPGKRKLNRDEPSFTPLTRVSPPDWLVDSNMSLAVVMWELTSKELCAQGLLCATDLAVLERWCVFHIQQYDNGLMLTLAEPDQVPLPQVAENDPYQGIDWVRDNGELYLAGDWLTETGLLDKPVQVAFGYGKIMLMTESDLIPV
ncbi:SymE family type I addiction module toxin [Xenorhabdus bovienii]|uniref:SymE family type I addiction module toxin n=1 Tax=Xenorhabdus bovienii TaxID=40576 RepID=UPI0023B23A60|nr:SymE family type I addiction module toxin [Xenorhabdus bovienii]